MLMPCPNGLKAVPPLKNPTSSIATTGSVSACDIQVVLLYPAPPILLQDGSLDALFGPAPIYTKIRDDNPTRYINGSKAKNVMVADGCVIEGEVENSILFRGVHIGKGAKVKNCVLMQDTVVEPNVELDCVVTDKNVKITAGKKLSGTESFPVYVQKNHTV